MPERRPRKVLVVLGTRPEAVKLAPLVRELQARPKAFAPRTCSTGQHADLVGGVLEAFSVGLDHDLGIMRANQDLTEITCGALTGLRDVLAAETPEVVVVQGDTTSALAGSLAAFYAKVPVAHVEAGLRSGDRAAPWPEEVNRRLISASAQFHFAPTASARDNLLREGVEPAGVFVTGNTVVDALHTIVRRWQAGETPGVREARRVIDLLPGGPGQRLVLVTCHRRESFGAPLESICRALREIARSADNVRVVLPVHLNPNVRETVRAAVGDEPGVSLIEPLGYEAFLYLLSRSAVVLSDSGGLQEEAPSFGKTVIVLRDRVDRPEGLTAGLARRVGTDADKIVAAALDVLARPRAPQPPLPCPNPYGDGRACRRIADALEKAL